jgi:hypothetical protein
MNRLRRARDAGVDLAATTARLERDGVDSFCRSHHDLLARIQTTLSQPAVSSWAGRP